MKWAKKITDVKARYDLGLSPAAVDRVTGILYINPIIFNCMTEKEKEFIIAHEIAHIKGQTTDEELTDAIASVSHFKNGGSLRASVFSLMRVLPEGHPRITLQLLRAEHFDSLKQKKNG